METAIAFGAIAGDFAGHCFGRLLRDGAVEAEILTVTPAQQQADRQPADLSENVPAGDVDGGLHVRMPLERGVHAAVEPFELTRIFAEQMRAKFANAHTNAFGVGRQIKRPQRTDLAVTDDARVGFHRNDGAVEHGDRLAAGPFVAALAQGEVHLVGRNFRNLHQSGDCSRPRGRLQAR